MERRCIDMERAVPGIGELPLSPSDERKCAPGLLLQSRQTYRSKRVGVRFEGSIKGLRNRMPVISECHHHIGTSQPKYIPTVTTLPVPVSGMLIEKVFTPGSGETKT